MWCSLSSVKGRREMRTGGSGLDEAKASPQYLGCGRRPTPVTAKPALHEAAGPAPAVPFEKRSRAFIAAAVMRDAPDRDGGI